MLCVVSNILYLLELTTDSDVSYWLFDYVPVYQKLFFQKSHYLALKKFHS
jgi:IS1 family transposase